MSLIFSLGRKGGSVHYANNILNNFEDEEHNDNLYFFSNKTVLKSGIDSKNVFNVPMYSSVFGFIVASLTILPMLLMLIALLRLFHRKIYFPYFHYWAVPILLVAKLFNYRSLVTVHDGIVHYGDGAPFEQILNIWYLRISTEVVFLTEYVRNKVVSELALPKRKNCYVVPHGLIPIEGLCAHDRTLDKKRRLNILFFGRVIKYKGVELLPDISIYLKRESIDHSISIVGKWNYEKPSSIVSNDAIKVYDNYIPESEIASFFNEADILVMPYLEATQSGVASLAIYGCLPVIATNVGGLPEQVEGVGIVADSNSESIFHSIMELYSDKNLYLRLVKNMNAKKSEILWCNIASRVSGIIKAL